MRRLSLFVIASFALGLTSAMWSAAPAGAENCLSVDGTGVCSTTEETVGGQSVGGGSTTVTTPPVDLVVPVGICYFLGCIPAGYTIRLVPGTSTTVPLPGPFTLPAQQVPGGWELRIGGEPVDVAEIVNDVRVVVDDAVADVLLLVDEADDCEPPVLVIENSSNGQGHVYLLGEHWIVTAFPLPPACI